MDEFSEIDIFPCLSDHKQENKLQSFSYTAFIKFYCLLMNGCNQFIIYI